MAFVDQGFTNSCGAYCLCYLQWLMEGRDPTKTPTPAQKTADYAQIRDVYAAIQFGDGTPVLPPEYEKVPDDYCDPVRMTLLLLSKGADVSVSIAQNSTISHIFQAMNQPEKRDHAFIEALQKAHRIQTADPQAPEEDGEAAIAIFDILDSANTVLGQHYVLFRKKGESLYRYNPWDGIQTGCSDYAPFDCAVMPGVNVTLAPSGVAIMIP